MVITNNLLKLRERAGLSQNEIALRIGIARTTYASYEQGVREPDIEMINKLAEFHGVTVGELIGEKKEERSYALSESEFDIIIREAETKYKINLRDDPFVLETMKNLIDSYARTKLNQPRK